MLLKGLPCFFRDACGYVRADPAAAAAAGDDADRRLTYHRRVVVVAAACGACGFAAGAAFVAVTYLNGDEGWVATHWPPYAAEENFLWPVLFPLLGAAAGLLWGAALASAFAPRAFLLGPVGRKWMRLIGTRSVLGARVVCLAMAAAPAVLMGALFLLIFVFAPDR